MNRQFGLVINGEKIITPETLDIINPATQQIAGLAPKATANDLQNAVAAARGAFRSWSVRPIAERQNAIAELGKRIGEHAEELITLLTKEQGKPLSEARSEIMGCAWWCNESAKLSLADEVYLDNEQQKVVRTQVPIGVVGAITPWNFPVILAIWKIVPALLTGNTMVLKPSPFTPLTTLRLVELAADILPPGVLNVISGGDELGQLISEHPDIDKISFTGSVNTGKKIMGSASHTLKRLTLELGGNDAGIILPDVDPEKIAEQLFWSSFTNCGQYCAAIKRLYIHRDIFDATKTALARYAATVKVGNGLDEGVRVGPLQNPMQLSRVKELFDDSFNAGAEIVFQTDKVPGTGNFFPPTLLTGLDDNSRLVAEEQFGPLLPLLPYDTIDEVISRANNSDYGLGCSVWSADTEAAAALIPRLQAGTVWVNQHAVMLPAVPFGGIKSSGIGVENGELGLHEYTLPKIHFIAKG